MAMVRDREDAQTELWTYSGRLWAERAIVPDGLTTLSDEQLAALAGVTVADETAQREAADTALGKRIDAVAGYAAPVFEPSYWVKSGVARSILVHVDPRADAAQGLAKLQLTVQGIVKTVARIANQDVYQFAFTAADAANITRAAGNAGRDTVRADLVLLDASDARVLEPWRGLLRVVDRDPIPGAPTITVFDSFDGTANGNPTNAQMIAAGFDGDSLISVSATISTSGTSYGPGRPRDNRASRFNSLDLYLPLERYPNRPSADISTFGIVVSADPTKAADKVTRMGIEHSDDTAFAFLPADTTLYIFKWPFTA